MLLEAKNLTVNASANVQDSGRRRYRLGTTVPEIQRHGRSSTIRHSLRNAQDARLGWLFDDREHNREFLASPRIHPATARWPVSLHNSALKVDFPLHPPASLQLLVQMSPSSSLAHGALRTVFSAASPCLTLSASVAQLAPFPYLQQLLSLAVSILYMIQTAKDNKEGFQQLAHDAGELVYAVIKSQVQSCDMEKNLSRLVSLLSDIEKFALGHISRKAIYRVFTSSSDASKINFYRTQIQQALNEFGLKSQIRAHEDRAEIKEMLEGMEVQLRTLVRRPSSPAVVAPKPPPVMNNFNDASGNVLNSKVRGSVTVARIGGNDTVRIALVDFERSGSPSTVDPLTSFPGKVDSRSSPPSGSLPLVLETPVQASTSTFANASGNVVNSTVGGRATVTTLGGSYTTYNSRDGPSSPSHPAEAESPMRSTGGGWWHTLMCLDGSVRQLKKNFETIVYPILTISDEVSSQIFLKWEFGPKTGAPNVEKSVRGSDTADSAVAELFRPWFTVLLAASHGTTCDLTVQLQRRQQC
ncbi:hypothetical protein GGX14DRAFT_569982 [Mycena pura]|uniref:Uncharacterized protein n=1 Tax=Mycena pura TaxID=153505 RepID=A0AAD6YD76_9AGAR|nr:hypothetical protein GGX14DRAFT_569982 [Mycena pura]